MCVTSNIMNTNLSENKNQIISKMQQLYILGLC